MQHSATHCNTLHTATNCNTLHTATHCNRLYPFYFVLRWLLRCSPLCDAVNFAASFAKEPYKRDDIQLCIALPHFTLQHNATHLPTLTSSVYFMSTDESHCNTLQQTATHCNTLHLQHTATHLPTLTSSVYFMSIDEWHCNTLQHIATHFTCNTLQHIYLH